MPPTTKVSNAPTIMNQRTNLTGRVCPFWSIGLPESLASVAIFMSCTFSGRRHRHDPGENAGQLRSNCGVVKSDAPKQELAKLVFKAAHLAVRQTRDGREARHRGRQNGVVGEPEQIG